MGFDVDVFFYIGHLMFGVPGRTRSKLIKNSIASSFISEFASMVAPNTTLFGDNVPAGNP